MARAALILNYRRTSTLAFHALLAAIDEKRRGAELDIYFSNSAEKTIEILCAESERYQTILCAFSFYSPDAAAAGREVSRIKEELNCKKSNHSRNIIFLAGGVHATAEPRHTLQMGFDYAAIGEGENTILTIVDAIISGVPIRTLHGMAYLDGGELVHQGAGVRGELDDFPPFPHRYKKFGPIEITRGCVYACKFCQTPFMFKAKFRHRTIDNIKYYIGIMRENGLRDVRFVTPTSLSYGSDDETVHLTKVEELLSAANDAIGPRGRVFYGTFPSEVRPEHVTSDALRLLKKYVANDNLVIGGQSGSDEMLDRMSRGHSVESVENAVRLCREYQFIPNVDFIFGFAGETPESAEATVAFAEKLVSLGARVHAHSFMPLPGTPLRGASYVELNEKLQFRLARLVGSGEMFGQWKRQREIAAELKRGQVRGQV
ncbi:MAG: TIGR04013 family B12-binding domain/radical SAM domain-containing protein [Planctomycetota bacterium]